MSIPIVTAFPEPEHRADVIAAFAAAIPRVHDEPGVEIYAQHEGRIAWQWSRSTGPKRRRPRMPTVRPSRTFSPP